MENNRGITLASLTVYIIALVIILVALTFLSANFSSQIGEVIIRSGISNEYAKLCSFLISDLKSANNVLEFSDKFLRLDNDVKYEIKYIENRATERMQYEIYKNDVLVAENFVDAKFDYDEENHACIVSLKYLYNKGLVEKTQSIRVGRGY